MTINLKKHVWVIDTRSKRSLEGTASVASKEQSDFEVFYRLTSISLTLIEATGRQIICTLQTYRAARHQEYMMDKESKINTLKGILLFLLLLVTSLYILSILEYSYPRDRQGWIELAIILSIIPLNSCFEYQSNRLKTLYGPVVIMMVGFLCFGTLAKGAGIDIAVFYVIFALIAQIGTYYAIKYWGQSN